MRKSGGRGANQLAGLGVVIRNNVGKAIASAVKTVKSTGDVEKDKAKAVLWGLQGAIKAGADSVIIESNSRGVTELINNKRGTLTEIFWVIFDILEAKRNFLNFKAQHVHRNCNTLAQSLAKLALRKIDSWLDEFPADVLYLFSL